MYLYIAKTRDSNAVHIVQNKCNLKLNNVFFVNEGREEKYKNWMIKTKAYIIYLVSNDA